VLPPAGLPLAPPLIVLEPALPAVLATAPPTPPELLPPDAEPAVIGGEPALEPAKPVLAPPEPPTPGAVVPLEHAAALSATIENKNGARDLIRLTLRLQKKS
jgi:hypothetical protein